MARDSSYIRPNWRDLYSDQYVRIRDQLRGERAAGMRPRLGMADYSDRSIDSYSRKEAARRCEEAINRHNEKIELQARKGML